MYVVRCTFLDNQGCTNVFHVAPDSPDEPILVEEEISKFSFLFCMSLSAFPPSARLYLSVRLFLCSFVGAHVSGEAQIPAPAPPPHTHILQAVLPPTLDG